MGYIFNYDDRFDQAKPEDIVSFSVLCQGRSGVGLEEYRTRLTLRRLTEFLPTEETWAEVQGQLRGYGFEVFGDPSPVVSARGRVDLFQTVFGMKLRKRIRKI